MKLDKVVIGESMYKISLKNIDIHREYEYGDTSNKFVIENSQENIEMIYNEVMQKVGSNSLTDADKGDYPVKILNTNR